MIPPRIARTRRRQGIPIRRIGFFHYGSDHKQDPIGSLRAALLEAITTSDQRNVRDCLIGLPEAFNIRGGYWSPLRQTDPSIPVSLTRICKEFGVAFVVGLVEQSAPLSPPYSAAYLIDGSVRRLLSCKMEDDRSCNYRPWALQNSDQPVVYRGICVAALICMDAVFHQNRVSKRHTELLARMNSSGADRLVLFVPAHMMEYSSEWVAKAWPQKIFTVIANSASSQPSTIRLQEELIQTKPNENMRNVIHLMTLI